MMQMNIDEREDKLQKRLEEIEALEHELKERERALLNNEKAKKQVLLRLAPSLWDQISAWAQDDFRSINSQIEYLLNEAVKQRHSGNKKEKREDQVIKSESVPIAMCHLY